ncbi:uncharacterized protein J4E84_007224 [Alternaria hordeiaustralica]|uniref:uncharacterized protein n=1 Tax=Alternaria hordeiaustralica TaxID=1187925 RepID=UPI0020C51EA3|nr:uncharacterized protein J4E84_007224 [Alternaria hordeiaustralica]KAI4682760.1 hypothetical protein J4E84_007224 [Alternaria hordeiaustralica]
MPAVPKDHYLWTAIVRGRDGPANIAKAAELRALVAATAGCTIVKDFHPMEGHGFIYHMANTVESNPLQESAESMRAEVVDVSESQVDEGAEFPYTSADELSDDD